MESEVKTLKEFQKWVKIQLLIQDKTQRALAEEMSIAYPRISEALHGKKIQPNRQLQTVIRQHIRLYLPQRIRTTIP